MLESHNAVIPIGLLVIAETSIKTYLFWGLKVPHCAVIFQHLLRTTSLPTRAYARIDKELPSSKWSSSDMEAPSRERPRIEADEPRRANARRLRRCLVDCFVTVR